MLHHRLRAASGNFGRGIPTDGLVAWYTMDNIAGSTLVDEQGVYNGTINGAISGTGVIGQALDFDGVNDYVALSTVPDRGDNSQYTLSVWFRHTGAQSTSIVEQVFSFGNSIGFSYSHSSAVFRGAVFTRNSSGSFASSGNKVIAGDVWVHLVVVCNGGTITPYFDGVPSSALAWNGTYGTPTFSGMRLGCGGDSGGVPINFFNGKIDMVRLYNRALSQEEVTALYEEA